MSFLDNVLTSIGGKSGPPQAPKPRPQAASSTLGPSLVQKRKAEELMKDKDVKRERVEPPSSASDNVSKTSESPIPYRGTAGRSNTPSQTKPASKSTANAPTLKPGSKGATETAKLSASPALSSAPKPAPKGFAAILARGQAASQSVASQNFGAIKHKAAETRKERLAKEREEQIAAAKAKAAASRPKPGSSTNGKTPTNLKSLDKGGSKPKREPTDLGYKGTAKSAEPTYRGTAHFSSKSSSSKPRPYGSSAYDRSRSNSAAVSGRREDKQGRRSGYASYSSGEDLENDYDSEGSSDMEAGYNDVEHEERAALRAAIQDDAQELALEQSLKSEKDRRKAALARLSAERAKKKN